MSATDQTPNDAEYARLKAQSETSPGDPEIFYRLGTAAVACGRQDNAARAFAKAAQLKSNWAAPCFGLATALHTLGQEDAAITSYRSALALEPNHSIAHFKLAQLLEKKGHATDATVHYNAASLHCPDWPEPHLYRGALHESRGELEDARRAYDRAISLGAPEGFALRRDLQVPIIPVSKTSYAEGRASYLRALDTQLADPSSISDPIREAGGNRFFLAYHGLDDRPFQEKQARLMRTACPSLSWTAPSCRTAIPLGLPRRIGIASRFLHDHSIGRLMIGLLVHLHASEDCQVYLFHVVNPEDDDLRRKIETLADNSMILPGNLQAAREAIADTRLDILFYPDIGMDPVTYFLAQARLAPIQCTTWGHPVTTGIPTIDYFLSCDAAEPKGAEAHYSEILVRLGGLPSSYPRPSPPNPLGSRADFDLPAEATIYFLAQSLFKIHPDMDAPLAEILRGDPTGLILLLEGEDRNWGQILRDRFAENLGPDTERVVFLPRQSHENYMRLLALSDVNLDSFPFCGGNTTYQSLAMGTPVVTLPGDYLRGRVSLAIYRHMEMLDCVATDPSDFARIALRLGTEPEFRQAIEKQIETSSEKIFDDPIFLRDAQDFLLTVQPRPA